MSESESFQFADSTPEFKQVLELVAEFMQSVGKRSISNGTEGDYLETAFESYMRLNHPDIYDKVKRDPAIYFNALLDWNENHSDDEE